MGNNSQKNQLIKKSLAAVFFKMIKYIHKAIAEILCLAFDTINRVNVKIVRLELNPNNF